MGASGIVIGGFGVCQLGVAVRQGVVLAACVFRAAKIAIMKRDIEVSRR